jgi:hypothetical protein
MNLHRLFEQSSSDLDTLLQIQPNSQPLLCDKTEHKHHVLFFDRDGKLFWSIGLEFQDARHMDFAQGYSEAKICKDEYVFTATREIELGDVAIMRDGQEIRRESYQNTFNHQPMGYTLLPGSTMTMTEISYRIQ